MKRRIAVSLALALAVAWALWGRAEPAAVPRRAYDGAPPVIPHPPMGAPCLSCHGERPIEVEGLGFAPPSPHAGRAGMDRCRQCHVFRNTEALWVPSDFVGFRRELRKASEGTPPAVPHPLFLRENCAACHTGPAARREIRCSHPERTRCVQCHVPG